MVTAQDLVDSSTKADLVDQAKELGLNVKNQDGKPFNKIELAEMILEAEETGFQNPSDIIPEANMEVEYEVSSDVPAPEPETEPEKSAGTVYAHQQDVLVRFIGKNPILQVANQTFKKSSPFKVLSAEEAEAVFDSKYADKFRVANPKEAKDFYS